MRKGVQSDVPTEIGISIDHLEYDYLGASNHRKIAATYVKMFSNVHNTYSTNTAMRAINFQINPKYEDEFPCSESIRSQQSINIKLLCFFAFGTKVSFQRLNAQCCQVGPSLRNSETLGQCHPRCHHPLSTWLLKPL